MSKLPFSVGIFWKTLVVVVVLVVIAWSLYLRFSDYEMNAADYGGTIICTILLAYLVHLWLLPAEQLHGDTTDGDEEKDHDEDDKSQE